ncbi:MAG: homogentisate phytyltransferase [Oscillatoria sp. PMC 1051.18]|nr:homogentisate phytyltransferase [Oscillatoria sp. PMC 1050.18]MEC5029571.1 homogentisate phytyltransferase [Oscillatoria sp. PMC 1051.18]
MSQISATPKNLFREPFAWLYSLWKFSRPHTIIGTSLSVFALYAIATTLTTNTVTIASLLHLLGAWIACLGGNVYIVGLNQLEDIAIDEINKPHLPVAAGEFTPPQATRIVAISGILALLLAAWLGFWLLATVGISLIIGTAYSLPPIRLKRFPFLAALCIFTVRGIIVNVGLFFYFSKVFGYSEFFPLEVWTLTIFVVVFTVAIAIFKDVPDIEGDKQFNITTFTLLLGKSTIFNLARGIITVCYLGTIIAGVFWLNNVNLLFLTISHFVLLGLLWWRSQNVNLQSKPEIASFYQFIWKLFFLEYLIFPLACFLA